MKELNWFDKLLIKLHLIDDSCWIDIHDEFPKLGQTVQIKYNVQILDFPKRIFISESFDWVINEKDKQEWIDILGSEFIYWRNCK